MDPLSPLLPIVHCSWQVLRATPRISTELLYVDSSWSPCFCSAMWEGPLENTYELVPAYPAVSCMSGSSNLVFVIGGRWPYRCCFVGVWPPGLVQNCSQHSGAIAVKLFLHPFTLRPCLHNMAEFSGTMLLFFNLWKITLEIL